MKPPIEDLIIKQDSSIRDAMQCIDKSGQGIAFITDSHDLLIGIVTDGDIRRSILQGSSLADSVLKPARFEFVSKNINSENIEILKTLTDKIKVIPLVDDSKRLVDYATVDHIRKIPVASPSLNGNELDYVNQCIKTNWISSQGKFVSQFERMFDMLHPGMNALAVSNGTVALHLALIALGIGEGDEVIVPDFTFAATINAVIYTGATPVLVDVSPDSWNIDPSQISKAITDKTKAIIAVHIYGLPAMMKSILEIVQKNNLKLIEDCAEALGSKYDGVPVGTFGDAATFSFFGNKTITTGEGGMVLFKSSEKHERAQLLRDHGMSKAKRYWHDIIGYNYRLTNIQAAIGVAQLERIEEIIAKKIEIGNRYFHALKKFDFFIHPYQQQKFLNTFWLYTIRLSENAPFTRDELCAHLGKKGVETRPVFNPLHVMPPYRKYAGKRIFHNSNKISKTGFSLPSSTSLTNSELEYVINEISKYCEQPHKIKA